jgi:hypothetical protein
MRPTPAFRAKSSNDRPGPGPRAGASVPGTLAVCRPTPSRTAGQGAPSRYTARPRQPRNASALRRAYWSSFAPAAAGGTSAWLSATTRPAAVWPRTYLRNMAYRFTSAENGDHAETAPRGDRRRAGDRYGRLGHRIRLPYLKTGMTACPRRTATSLKTMRSYGPEGRRLDAGRGLDAAADRL